MEAAPSPRTFEVIRDQIRTQLALGRLKAGDKLPAERELAANFNASRTAVREALRGLEMSGVIELRKGVKGGAFIKEGDPGVVTRSFGDMVNLGRITLESLTESRVLITDSIIRLACERGSTEDFDALEASIEKTEAFTREGRIEDRRRQLLHFYHLLGVATRNEVMVIIMDALTDIVLKVMARDDTAPRLDTSKAHRAILQQLRKRDAAKAAELMTAHLENLHGHLFLASKKPTRSKTP
ncbi:FadR/GntR family transcriptional regulator [Ramlibacter albus]|uniref:FadR family transcriptional regulator n=1 Tax=Ramlibacter albus TaxID=2079448 RepID=A0A923M9H9_9BURK|nr:FCD domain-containing protein [Ramlibacter albus]MBC5765835.1 FadR family transcriptional regulator [Ramlibacter albus]